MPKLPAEANKEITGAKANPTHERQAIIRTRTGFQIAQGEKTEKTEKTETGAAGTHTSTEKPEEEEQVGAMPDATLLFWNSTLVVVMLVAFALMVKRSLQRIPTKYSAQNFGEAIVEFINSQFTVGIIGPGGEKYTPLVGTIFIFILISNLIGLVPGLHSPTGNLSITLAIGIVVFVYVQYVGVRDNGLGGHLKHFAGPMPVLAPLMFPIELISEIVKPFTLAIRLFGNIFGEDVILVVLTGLILKITGSMVFGWIPAQFPVLLLSLMTAGVQALVFSMLTCIYISLVSHHEHEGAHGEEGAVEGGHAHAAH